MDSDAAASGRRRVSDGIPSGRAGNAACTECLPAKSGEISAVDRQRGAALALPARAALPRNGRGAAQLPQELYIHQPAAKETCIVVPGNGAAFARNRGGNRGVRRAAPGHEQTAVTRGEGGRLLRASDQECRGARCPHGRGQPLERTPDSVVLVLSALGGRNLEMQGRTAERTDMDCRISVRQEA